MITKYKIVSESLGTYAGFFGRHSFSHDESVISDFISESGAKSMMEIMPLMEECPNDLKVVPFIAE